MNRPVHFEILGDDPAKLSEFYKTVFGWTIATWDGPQGYWLATTGEDTPGINGGFMAKHLPQTVINTIEVESMADTLAAIETGGGKLVHGPQEIPGVGNHAYFADPEGILFGVMEPKG